ncbi:GNAT family N-acetyltransferase [Fulvivirgaceae bacterium PWU4]|uniref:GNAT family N-acetyltransferase n=1 Tax=Chryseosolibacter histidini TaxID=2782349 RepID=A0AAP2GMR7_9BACT|nr:GNAT family N-acetyltransferase [Chryseosolibacter histidini]MBT1701529.1 GNAT family N-acetyltransferase [Chryseosolibacter histidini]
MIVKQVLPTDKDVVSLIEKLNEYQIGLYGLAACNLESPESLLVNNAFMVGAFMEDTLIGIGAVKIVDTYAELKRMFVREEYRGLPCATLILTELENYARSKGIAVVFLETGNQHHAAIRFYKRMGYREVDSFGAYRPNDVSVYFSKELINRS